MYKGSLLYSVFLRNHLGDLGGQVVSRAKREGSMEPLEAGRETSLGEY